MTKHDKIPVSTNRTAPPKEVPHRAPAPAVRDSRRPTADLTPMGRQRASEEAVVRRRLSRRAATAANHRVPPIAELDPDATVYTPKPAAAALSPAAERHRKVARRMAVRFAAGVAELDMLTLDYRYWQACRCGWDVRDEDVRTVGHDRRTGEPILCDPTDTPHWRWWIGLHYKTRDMLVTMSDLRVVRSLKFTGRRRQGKAASKVANN